MHLESDKNVSSFIDSKIIFKKQHRELKDESETIAVKINKNNTFWNKENKKGQYVSNLLSLMYLYKQNCPKAPTETNPFDNLYPNSYNSHFI